MAALARIDQLESELASFRADPAYERVALAEEALARSRARRAALARLLPRICIAAFVGMGAFALTNPALPPFVQSLAYVLSAAGALTASATIAWMLGLSAQGSRPKALVELERRVRLARGDVGMASRARLALPAPAGTPRETAS
ncbi:MAG: hypothetical protein JST00_04005 [Deltaproteobacteria bacterium]|nr:hypothetical protein [Deltaproteobacteria bacterium]